METKPLLGQVAKMNVGHYHKELGWRLIPLSSCVGAHVKAEGPVEASTPGADPGVVEQCLRPEVTLLRLYAD